MTFPIFVAIHLAYGAAMAFAVKRRLLSEGEVLGVPLLWTLLPVGLISAPVGASLLRFAGKWFLHGALHDGGAIAFERWHLGLMFAVGMSAGIATVAGMFFAIGFLSRDRRGPAFVPFVVAALAVVGVLVWDGANVFDARPPALIATGVDVSLLFLAWGFARQRLSMPVALRA